jgi:predicted DsbA family dithiol-disulfide isomerase
MKVTYYLEILSSWCYWAEPTWLELKRRYEGRVDFQWKIALMRPSDFPASLEQNNWFYQRSGTVMRSSFKLNTGWFEAARKGEYRAPNLVAEGARQLGVSDDRAWLALNRAALLDGRKVGDLEESVKIAAQATGLSPDALRTAAQSPEVREKAEASTAEFYSHQVNQRPTFVLEDAIGDKAVFSGLVRIEPLAATIEAMLADTAAYASFKAHFGTPPTA